MTGREALDRHLAAAFPGQRPILVPSEGPLEKVVAHRAGDHWHYTSYGLTELDGKTWPDPNLSGWGHELVLRLAGTEAGPTRGAGTEAGLTGGPPAWPAAHFQHFAGYIAEVRRPFLPGDHLLARSLLENVLGGEFAAYLCLDDPLLGGFDGPNGRVELVQLLAIRDDELWAVRTGRLREVMHYLPQRWPTGVTVQGRRSLLTP